MSIKLFLQLNRLPYTAFSAAIMILCAIGAFGLNNSMDDLYIMFAFGIIGYVPERLRTIGRQGCVYASRTAIDPLRGSLRRISDPRGGTAAMVCAHPAAGRGEPPAGESIEQGECRA